MGTGGAAERRKKRVSQSLSTKSSAFKDDSEAAAAAAADADANLLNAVRDESLCTCKAMNMIASFSLSLFELM